jgi:hypothetical protein
MKLISEALVKFQSELRPIEKDAENPFFKSEYLTLAGILKNALPVLTKCGLSVIQPMRIEGDKTVLMTRLMHVSGEFLLSEMIMPTLADPQKTGSLITYYKRYQLQAMLGISSVEEDDDGNSVSAQNNFRPKQTHTTLTTTNNATEQQKKAIWAISKAKNIPMPEIKSFKEAQDWIKEMNQK